MKKLYDFCDECVLKFTCRHLTGEIDNSKMLQNFCMPYRMANHNFDLAGVPARFRFANVNDYRDNQELLRCLRSILKALKEGRNVSVFCHSRETGTGKSHYAATILNTYLTDKLREVAGNKGDIFPEEPFGFFIDYAYLINMLRDRYKDDYTPEAINFALEANLLVLDDVGSGKMSDYAREQTNILINHRYSNNLATIITSNLSLEELEREDMLGKRAVSRIRDGAIVLDFNFKDRRDVRASRKVGGGN